MSHTTILTLVLAAVSLAACKDNRKAATESPEDRVAAIKAERLAAIKATMKAAIESNARPLGWSFSCGPGSQKRDVCTGERTRVCGNYADFTVKTFDDMCQACRDEKVLFYVVGACTSKQAT